MKCFGHLNNMYMILLVKKPLPKECDLKGISVKVTVPNHHMLAPSIPYHNLIQVSGPEQSHTVIKTNLAFKICIVLVGSHQRNFISLAV